LGIKVDLKVAEGAFGLGDHGGGLQAFDMEGERG
jgi:hypothetical protein